MILAHLADIHFGREDAAAVDIARQAILAANADAVIVSGDLTQRGKRSEFEAARNYLQSFRLPVLSVPGNHDTPLLDMQARALDPFGRYDNYLGDFSASLELDRAIVEGFNTARGWQARSNWAEGSVNLEHLDALIESGPQRAGAVRMLACHHPFQVPSITPLRVATRRGRRASRRLAASDISILLTGHIHAPHAEVIREAEGAYLAISAGTLSSRLRASAPSFNLLSIEPDRLALRVMQLKGGTMSEAARQGWTLPDLRPVHPAPSRTGA